MQTSGHSLLEMAGLDRLRRVSKDEGPTMATWFETPLRGSSP